VLQISKFGQHLENDFIHISSVTVLLDSCQIVHCMLQYLPYETLGIKSVTSWGNHRDRISCCILSV